MRNDKATNADVEMRLKKIFKDADRTVEKKKMRLQKLSSSESDS